MLELIIAIIVAGISYLVGSQHYPKCLIYDRYRGDSEIVTFFLNHPVYG